MLSIYFYCIQLESNHMFNITIISPDSFLFVSFFHQIVKAIYHCFRRNVSVMRMHQQMKINVNIYKEKNVN